MADIGAIRVGRFRLESIDVLRGLVMILMALGHTRDFLGVTSVNPTDPAQTTMPLFFTRWIPHWEVLPNAETAD